MKIKGRLCVFRESSQVQHLSAEVKTENGTEYYYSKVPKCFDDIITCGIKNVCHIEYTAREDGSYPRNVVKLSECE